MSYVPRHRKPEIVETETIGSTDYVFIDVNTGEEMNESRENDTVETAMERLEEKLDAILEKLQKDRDEWMWV